MPSPPAPPAAEAALGLTAYLTATAGIGGRLRTEAEDFLVVEEGAGPTPAEDGPYTAARIRLRNWETNRFVERAARELRIRPGQASFAGLKDKRAVTEQVFTFRCPRERLAALDHLQDVEVLEAWTCRSRHYPGAHAGNRFRIRVRGHAGDPASVEATAAAVRREGGVPNFFGPQRFGASFRPITHLVGAAIVAGDLEEAVRLFVGNPLEGERPEALEARRIYQETRDAAQTLAAFPAALRPERAVLERLVQRPGDWRRALGALPQNLLQLFVHAHQSLLFNRILSARMAAGLGLRTVHVGDRVMASGDDGRHTHPVSQWNLGRVQRELDRGRAVVTAPLVGTGVPLAAGVPGEVEAQVLDAARVDPAAFRCHGLPQVASEGRRRGALLAVRGLDVEWMDGDPVFAFSLGRGAYATAVLREFMKSDVGL